jgi:hypothetical protein
VGKLVVEYDLANKSFVYARLDGRPLPGLSWLSLGKHIVSATDSAGRDLKDMLAAAGETEESSPDQARAALEVARMFGYNGDAPLPERDDLS